MMDLLESAAQAHFDAHRELKPVTLKHTKYLLRYKTDRGAPIAFERRGNEYRNVYVLADNISVARLADLAPELYDGPKLGKFNSNLIYSGFIKRNDLVVRFEVTNLDQVERILAEVLL